MLYYYYDSLDRVSFIAKGTPTMARVSYKFIYDGEGNLYELRNYDTKRSTFFEYDHAGKCMACVEKSFTGNADIVEYTGTVSGYRYSYDKNNNLIKIRSNMDGMYWNTDYTYDKDNRPSQITLSNDKTINYTYGSATGRLDYITYNLNVEYEVDVTYKSGANGSATSLISTYQNGSDEPYRYNYDANGNITQIWRGSTSFAGGTERYSYVYDAANQLIRENLYYGSGNANNATITYEYDAWGNLLRKNIYAYTTVSTLGTPKDTMLYEYSDGNWGDVLSTYDGEEISYDKSGNPTNYFGNVLRWEGKQLESFTPKTEGSGRVNPYTYAYDESGIRTRKVVGNTTYEYYYCGELLMGIKQTVTDTNGSTTTTKQRFSYDVNGNVLALNYDGTYYYYIRNAQNDVVGLVDKNGNTVVSYTYDSWGKPLATTGSLANTLGADQPFRYRGYIYDNETGWYYLKSRYYNPEVGRFISPDVYLSTGQGVLGHNAYAYCLNNYVNMIDSEGFDPKDLFESIDEAAHDAAIYINSGSISENIEYSVAIYEVKKKEINISKKTMEIWGISCIIYDIEIETKIYYSYSTPLAGDSASSTVPDVPFYRKRVAIVHSHAAYDPRYNNETFSKLDFLVAEDIKLPSYLATPAGRLLKYDYATKKIWTLATDLPFDPFDPLIRTPIRSGFMGWNAQVYCAQ